MLSEFESFVKKEKLITKGHAVLLAVSGGLDSRVMCDLFHQAGYEFEMAHINFCLRGFESDGDEAFVKEMASSYKVPFHTISFDTEAIADKEKWSIQMAARKLRYDFLESVRKSNKLDLIATAHHLDDLAETMLINLVRGTGISGLHGILPIHKKIIRPLLFADRRMIEKYASDHKLKYRDDSSNESDKYVRNKLRHHVLPVLKEINPALLQTMQNNADRFRQVEQIFKSFVKKKSSEFVSIKKSSVHVHIDRLRKVKEAEAVLFEILSPFGFGQDVVQNVLDVKPGKGGKKFFSTSYELFLDRNLLIIERKRDIKSFDQEYRIQKNTRTLQTENFSLKTEFVTTGSFVKRMNQIKKFDTHHAFVDADKLVFPLILRKKRDGDFMFPLGMKGKKKISDILIDSKISLKEKARKMLITSNGEVVCLAGMRTDERFKVRPSTKRIFHIIWKELRASGK